MDRGHLFYSCLHAPVRIHAHVWYGVVCACVSLRGVVGPAVVCLVTHCWLLSPPKPSSQEIDQFHSLPVRRRHRSQDRDFLTPLHNKHCQNHILPLVSGYIYIYIYIYIYLYIHTHTHIHTYTYLHIVSHTYYWLGHTWLAKLFHLRYKGLKQDEEVSSNQILAWCEHYHKGSLVIVIIQYCLLVSAHFSITKLIDESWSFARREGSFTSNWPPFRIYFLYLWRKHIARINRLCGFRILDIFWIRYVTDYTDARHLFTWWLLYYRHKTRIVQDIQLLMIRSLSDNLTLV